MLVNAFHKDYVKTYMPEFLSTIRTESAAMENGQRFGAKSRASKATRENLVDKVKSAINLFPKTKRVSIAVTEFHIYSKAGMQKGVK